MSDLRLHIDQNVTAGIDRTVAGLTNTGPVKQGLVAGVLRWLSYLRQRYNAASHGDGTWPDIKESTKRARLRRVLGPGRRRAEIDAYLAGAYFEILKDTGTLYNSLQPGNAGNVQRDRPLGVEIESTVPYAVYHQRGNPPLPERAIVVQPDAETESAIRSDLQRGVDEVLKGAGLL